MNIYVGNLSYNVTEEDLKKAFGAFGQVASASVIRDQFSDRSKGFGFVEMPESSEAQAAISGLNGNGAQWANPERKRSQAKGGQRPERWVRRKAGRRRAALLGPHRLSFLSSRHRAGIVASDP